MRERMCKVACLLVCSAVLAACGGHSSQRDQATGATSGTSASVAGGGAAGDGDGVATGSGASSGQTGGTSSAGSTPVPGCDKVTCPALPTTCKKIVQGPSDCCPTCPDTGCDACPDIDCAAGTHSETVGGDCCPSCVADPPDACVRDQEAYAELRAQLLEKYSSSSCKNSAECSLVLEDTACGYTCNVALPTFTASSFTGNLESAAPGRCSSCEPPERITCDDQLPACVNGKCVGADLAP